MKHCYLRHLFTALMLLCTTVASAHDFEVDGIYYNILSEENKTVAVTFKGTSYSEYSNEYSGSVVIPETVTMSKTVKTFDTWTSTNKNNSTTSQTSYTLNVAAGDILKFDWSVSSESNYDWLIITLDGTEIVKKSGTLSGSYEKTFDTSGSHTLVVKYTKDGSQSSGNDEGKIYNITLSGVGSVNDVVYRVTSIDSSAFNGCTGLTSIEIPNSVTRFRDEVFSGCTGLTNIEIPNSVTSIGEWAFKGCTGLTSIVIPNSVASFGDEVFSGCSGLTSIEIPNGVGSLGARMFRGCSNLESIVDHREDITSYGSALSHCYGLKSFEIPNSVTYVGAKAFRDCTGLTSIVIPDCVYYIGEQAFYNCSNLESVVLPDSLKCIESYTFYFCTNLASVVIPNSVTSIGINAFESCRNLTSVVIPSSVTSLAYMAFGGCTGLTSVTSLIPAENLFGINIGVFKNVDKNACTLYVPYGAKETYASTEGWDEFVNIVELAPTEVAVTIGQYGSTTYCSEFALDFSEVEGLKAYNAIGYKPSTQVITLARVMTAGAGQGVFIKGEPGEYTVPVIDNFDEFTLNMLVGVLEKTTVNSTSSDGVYANYKYTIKSGDTTPMFYQYSDNSSISAGKAYLQIPLAWLPASASKAIDIRFDEGEFTDIDEIDDELKGENGKAKTVYDLQGRVVENPTSGIYIIDGKKVLIK